MLVDWLGEYINDVVSGFTDPRKRIFVGYLVSAFIVAVLWLLLVKGRSLHTAIRAVFSKHIWLSASAKIDYKIFLLNKVVSIVLSPLLITQLALATTIFYWLYDVFPSRPLVVNGWSDFSIAAVFTLSYFLLDDFARYYLHRLMHSIPVLWCFHKVHHSADKLTPFTVFRAHPVEILLFTLRSTLTQGIAIGGFVFFMGDSADLVTVLGANVLLFTFNLIGSNLRHSHVAIHYPEVVEKIFISPAQHQIHHSLAQQHWNKNYGAALAIWDWAFGSHCHSERNKNLSFGLSEPVSQNLRAIYIAPFVECYRLIQIYFMVLYKRLTSFYCYCFKVADHAKISR